MDLGYCDRLDDLTQLAKQNPMTIDISLCDPPRYGFAPDPSLFHDVDLDALEYGYPQANEDFIDGILIRTKEFTGYTAERSEVIVSSGLGSAFGLLAIALHGQSVGTHTPFYSPVYEYFRRTTNLWFFRCTPELRWGVDIDSLRAELDKRNEQGYLIIVNPSNPTGHVLSSKEMNEVINLAGEYNQVVISDEVYDEMCFGPFTSALSIAKDVPVVYMHGFSKVWRAPEIRLGYMILHDPDGVVSDSFSEVKRVSKLAFGVNPYSQMIGTQLLKERREYRQEQFQELRARRDALNQAIMESNNLSSVEADGATYQLIQTPWNDWEICEHLLNKHNMLATPASVFDPYIGHDYLRVVFLNKPAILRSFVSCLDQGFGK